MLCFILSRQIMQITRLNKLFTHEDGAFFHAHKLLGLCALLSFVWRGGLWLSGGSTGLGSDDALALGTWATMFVHAMLHVTSFQFALSERRNRVYNIIWPEMRWHTAIFAYRCIISMAIALWGIDYQITRTCLIFTTMISADIVSWWLGDKNNTTMRGNPFPDYVPGVARTIANRFYSMSQAGATLIILTGRDLNSAYFLLLPIQLAPFLMTLERKGIISQLGWHIGYIATLAFVYLYETIAPRQSIFTWSETALIMTSFAIARLHFGLNKYVFWSIVSVYAYWCASVGIGRVV